MPAREVMIMLQEQKYPRLNLRLDGQTRRKLIKIAAMENKSVSEFIRLLIDGAVELYSKRYDLSDEQLPGQMALDDCECQK